MTTLDNEIKQLLSNKYCCEKCDYVTSRKHNMTTHLLSAKHKKTTTYNINSAENNDTSAILSKYCCPACDKKYNDRAGLWRHKKKCIKDPIDNTNNKEDEPNESDDDDTKSKKAACNIDTQMLLDVLKQNQEFQMFMMEQHKQMMEMAKSFNTNTINNTNCNNNNNTFNLQLFLNEKCKDALNMNEFVDTIKMQLSDLENFAHVGYADGVSKICVKNLNNLATFLRPIHCSDVKRETLYIKHNDEWIKESEDKALLRDAIKKIANKNIRQINEWIKENPNCTDPRSKNNDKYLKIVMNAMSGTTVEEQQENMDKIVKNVTKAVAIDKYALRS
jgi:hypothetical protein